jgi:hypothetical protein
MTSAMTLASRLDSKVTSVAPIRRYLVIQSSLAIAVSITIDLAFLLGDVGRLGLIIRESTPENFLIFLIGSVTTFFPLVMATALAFVPGERDR